MLPRNFRSIFAAYIVAMTFGSTAMAFQDEPDAVPAAPNANPDGAAATDEKPPIEYEGEVPKVEDPLAGEAPASTRITRDATALAEAVGGETGPKLEPLFSTLFDGSKLDDDRLMAASTLRELVGSIDEENRASRSLRRQLDRRINLAEAGVLGLRDGKANEEARQLTNELLIRAAIDYEHGNRAAHATIVRRNYRILRENYQPVFVKIDPVFARDYFNYNLHFTLSEPMMSRLVTDYRTESGGVADCILGAWVTGTQVTDTIVQADIKPGLGSAFFNIEVYGHTRTDTQGRKKPATVYSQGNHRFVVKKPTFFNGTKLSAASATMDVKMSTRTKGIRTDFDGIPLIGEIARGIAADKVQEQQPQANAIAARKMANRVLPEFEKEIGEKFDEANENIETNILAGLRERGIEPTAFSARSSETHLAVSSRTISGETLAAPGAPSNPAPRRGMAIQMHQSAINAAIDGLGIEGQLTPIQVIETIEDGLSDLLKRDVEIAKEGVENNTVFDFSSSDPIRVRFEEGRAVVILRTGFIQKDRDRTVPRHLLEIPLAIAVADGKIVMTPPDTSTRGIIALKPKPLEGRASPQTVIQARAVIKNLLVKTFPDPTIEVDSVVQVEMADGSPLELRIKTLELTDGWLTVIMD